MASGPNVAGFGLLALEIEQLMAPDGLPPARLRGLLDRLSDLVLTQKGEPRKRLAHTKAHFRSTADYERHKTIVFGLGPHVQAAIDVFRKDINLVLARGVRRLFAIAQDEYRRTLDKHGVLDFPDLLERTLKLLGQMEEFSRSRYRLESRYEHVLVDEFQDTSRAQWRLVRELVRAWAAGEGLSHGPIPPSIFIVGDRKQSIYGFRDAEVTVLDAAAQFVDALRPETPARAAITRSYRSVHELLMFVNDVCVAIDKADRPDAFRYTEDDAFPVIAEAPREAEAIGVITGGFRSRAGRGRGRRDCPAAAGTRHDSRSAYRRAPSDRPRRHRRPVPDAREPCAVRGRPREARRPVLRLQGPRLLRRRRDQGRAGARQLPGGSVFEPAEPPRCCAHASSAFQTKA